MNTYAQIKKQRNGVTGLTSVLTEGRNFIVHHDGDMHVMNKVTALKLLTHMRKGGGMPLFPSSL